MPAMCDGYAPSTPASAPRTVHRHRPFGARSRAHAARRRDPRGMLGRPSTDDPLGSSPIPPLATSRRTAQRPVKGDRGLILAYPPLRPSLGPRRGVREPPPDSIASLSLPERGRTHMRRWAYIRCVTDRSSRLGSGPASPARRPRDGSAAGRGFGEHLVFGVS
jgi:hypothetical protein